MSRLVLSLDTEYRQIECDDTRLDYANYLNYILGTGESVWVPSPSVEDDSIYWDLLQKVGSEMVKRKRVIISPLDDKTVGITEIDFANGHGEVAINAGRVSIAGRL